jgi:hypothetical protein
MRINESVFRKILREEARRVLNEAEGTPPAAAPAGAIATPAGGAGAVSGPPTAAASGALTAAQASHDVAFKAAQVEGNRLVGLIAGKGPAAQYLVSPLGLGVGRGISKLKDPKSPEATNLQTAVSQASGRGTAQGVAGRNLMLFAALVTGRPISDWKAAVKALGYTSALSADASKLDDPSKIANPDPGLKSLIDIANAMGDQFNTAVTALLGTSQGVKAAAAGAVPKAAPAGAPAPGTAPAAAAGPAKDWSGYNSKVKNGAAVQGAWTEYITKVTPQGFNASFGSFVKYYNALIKQMNVKYLSPDQMIKHLKDKVAAAAATAGLTPVTIAPDTSVPSLGGGALQGVEANAAAQAAANAASIQNLRTPNR